MLWGTLTTLVSRYLHSEKKKLQRVAFEAFREIHLEEYGPVLGAKREHKCDQ